MIISEQQIRNIVRTIIQEKKKKGLWDNIHAKRKRGEKPAKPGEKGYPSKKAWDETTNECDENLEESDADESAFMGALAAAKADGKEEVEIDGEIFPVTMDDETAEEISGKKVEETLRRLIRQALLREFDKDKMNCNKPRYLKDGETGYGKKQKVVKACDPDSDKEKIVKFGDAKMRNNSDKPKNKANFRSRHNCSDKNMKKDWDAAGYWACKDW